MTTTDKKHLQVHRNFLAMCPNYWGAGDTIEDAKARMKAHGGSLARYVVYSLPAASVNPFVDDMGSIRWEWVDGHRPDDYDPDAEVRIVAKRGV